MLLTILVPFLLAFWKVGLLGGVLFVAFSYMLYFPVELVSGMVGVGIAQLFERKPRAGDTPETYYLRQHSARMGLAKVVSGAVGLALGLWLLERFNYVSLRPALLWALVFYSIASYVDMWFHKMYRRPWWLGAKILVYLLVYGAWTS